MAKKPRGGRPGNARSVPADLEHFEKLGRQEQFRLLVQLARRDLRGDSLFGALVNYWAAREELCEKLEPYFDRESLKEYWPKDFDAEVRLKVRSSSPSHTLSLRDDEVFWDDKRVPFTPTQLRLFKRCVGSAEIGYIDCKCWGAARTLEHLKTEASRMRKRIRSVAGALPIIADMISIQGKKLCIIRNSRLAEELIVASINSSL